jgi:hypothetical protein
MCLVGLTMKDAEAWAKAVNVIDALRGRHSRVPEEPRLAIERISTSAILCGSLLERFSIQMPTLVGLSPAEEKLRPIDILYGSYDPNTRTITIYFKNIQRDAAMFEVEFSDLLAIVRRHEYAHAFIHLGVHSTDAEHLLENVGRDGYTNWQDFLDRRLKIFQAIDSNSHEFLAQALTFASTLVLEAGPSQRLTTTFAALEDRQPPAYRLPANIKASAHLIDWSLILAAVGGEIDAWRGPSFSMHEGLAALVLECARQQISVNSNGREYLVAVDDLTAVAELKTAMSEDERPANDDRDRFELLIDRCAGLRIEVVAREHPPPHFRVTCGGESANYRIADCFQLNGGLHRHYSSIRAWHVTNKTKIIETWNRLRPSDCPVGEYREA